MIRNMPVERQTKETANGALFAGTLVRLGKLLEINLVDLSVYANLTSCAALSEIGQEFFACALLSSGICQIKITTVTHQIPNLATL